jgi:hypothetical protein
LGDLLESIYRKLDSLPELKFYFSKDGQKFYDDWYDKKYEQTRNEARPGLQAAMAKMPGQAARLIGVLHVLNGVSTQPAEVKQEISLETVRAGCHLAQFYLGQVTVLQGDGDALHGELTPILKSLLEKVNELGSLTARQAQSAISGLRSSTSDKVRQHFKELAAMDLANVQGAGSRLALTSKVLTSADEILASADEILASADEVLINPQPPKTLIYQEVEQTNQPTADSADAVQIFDADIQPPNIGSDLDVAEVSVEESEISEKTSALSALAKSEPETLIQQEKKGADKSSALSSAVDKSSALSSNVDDSSTKPSAAKKPNPRIFELGDRVVIKDVGGRYQGVRGVITEIRPHSTHTGLMVKFDKEVAFSQQCEFIAGDLMYLAPRQ